MLQRFANQHISSVLVVPIGFVSDHMEILYDVDILFKNLAKQQGMNLQRTASLNDSPKFIKTLKAVVHLNIKNGQPSRSH